MTETATLTLTGFLLARIAEDEAVHRQKRALIGVGDHTLWCMEADYDDGLCGYCGAAVTRAEPIARVLAECEAKRRIVAEHWDCVGSCGTCEFTPQGGANNWPCLTIRALASVYADHPDYRDEWRP